MEAGKEENNNNELHLTPIPDNWCSLDWDLQANNIYGLTEHIAAVCLWPSL
jgi:hypothetical protein